MNVVTLDSQSVGGMTTDVTNAIAAGIDGHTTFHAPGVGAVEVSYMTDTKLAVMPRAYVSGVFVAGDSRKATGRGVMVNAAGGRAAIALACDRAARLQREFVTA